MPGKERPYLFAGSSSTEAQPAPGSEDDRLRAIALLAGDGDTTSAAQLIEMLADPRWRVRRAAAEALARCDAPGPALQALLEALRLRNRDLGLLNGVLRVLSLTTLPVGPALVGFLTADDPDLRIYAAQALGERGNPDAVAALLGRLADPDVNVRAQAIEALGKLRSARATDALLTVALEREFATAWPALDALGAIGDARIAPLLLPLLEDDLLAEPAILALGQLGNEEAIAPLLALLATDRVPATAVVRALDRIHGHYDQSYNSGSYIAALVRGLLEPAAFQKLLAIERNCTAEETPALARLLGWLGNKAAIDTLAALLARPESRAEAGEALVKLGADAAQGLSPLLQSEDASQVRKVLEIMGRTGAKAQVPDMVAILDRDDALTPIVLGALAMIGSERAYPAVTKFLAHPHANLRQAAVAAVNCIAHSDRARDAQAWLQDASPLLRESALKIACYLGFPECLDAIFACCSDANEHVRAAAIENAALLEDARAEEVILQALRADAPIVRAAAVRAIPMSSPQLSSQLLVGALEDADVWVRYFAARGLGAAPVLPPAAVAALAESAKNDAAMQVRIASTQALAAVGSADLLPLLAGLVQSPDRDLARAAALALGSIHDRKALELLSEMFEQGEPEQRLIAIEALATNGSASAVYLLARAAREPDPDLARTAMEALGRCQSAETIAALIDLLEQPRWRETCIPILVRQVPRRIDYLVSGLGHGDVDVRRTVVEILSRARSGVASQALRQAQKDPAPGVRFAALTALAHGPATT
jgi:HEAT repeat protein